MNVVGRRSELSASLYRTLLVTLLLFAAVGASVLTAQSVATDANIGASIIEFVADDSTSFFGAFAVAAGWPLLNVVFSFIRKVRCLLFSWVDGATALVDDAMVD